MSCRISSSLHHRQHADLNCSAIFNLMVGSASSREHLSSYRVNHRCVSAAFDAARWAMPGEAESGRQQQDANGSSNASNGAGPTRGEGTRGILAHDGLKTILDSCFIYSRSQNDVYHVFPEGS